MSDAAASAAREKYFARANIPQPTSTENEEPEEDFEDAPDDNQGAVGTNPAPSKQVQDEKDEMIRQLQAELNSMKGRVTPVQQDLERARLAVEEARRVQEAKDAAYQRQLAELQAELERKAEAESDPLSYLSDEEKDLIDETQARLITKLSSAIADKKLAVIKTETQKEFEKFSARQEEKARNDYFQYILKDPSRGLSDLPTLVNDPNFNAWLKSDDGAPVELMLNNFASAPRQDMDRLARLASRELKRYPGLQKPQEPEADPAKRLAAHTRRSSSSMSQSKIDSSVAQIKRLSASRNPADREKAKKLLADLRQ